ncbi:phosphopyruvate hydratase [Plasmodiophora brassicae]
MASATAIMASTSGSSGQGGGSPSATATSVASQSPKAQEVMEYLTTHELTQKLNDIVNACVRARADDPFAFMATQMHRIQQPATITRVRVVRLLSSVHVSVYGKCYQPDQLCGAGSVPQSDPPAATTTSAEEVSQALTALLKGQGLADLVALDQLVSDLSKEWAPAVKPSLSTALAISVSQVSHLEPYALISSICFGQQKKDSELAIPSPLVEVARPRASKYRAIGIVALPPGQPLLSQLQRAQTICKALESVGTVAANGTVTIDGKKFDDVLNVIEKAITSTGVVLGEQVGIWVDVGADACFVAEANEYEVDGGASVSREELFAQYESMLASHPAVSALIDPFHRDDRDGWALFANASARRCTPISSSSDPIPGAAVSVSLSSTVSQAIQDARSAREANCDVVISRRPVEGPESIIADVAVGVGAKFARFGPIAPAENACKYDRLLQIESALQAAK